MTRWLTVSVVLTLAALVSAVYVSQVRYDDLPERIPIHWNFEGQADGWVSRDQPFMAFYLTPSLMAGFVLLTVALPWLSPKPFEVERFKSTYAYIMTLIVVFMAYVHGIILYCAFHPEVTNGKPLVAGILLLFALMGNVMGQVRRNFWMGVRTPWTLASERVWNGTHRVTAWLFVAYGLIGFVAVLLDVPLLWIFAGLMVVALAVVLYSLVLYKVLEKQGKLESSEQPSVTGAA